MPPCGRANCRPGRPPNDDGLSTRRGRACCRARLDGGGGAAIGGRRELVLAADGSGSIDEDELRLQREGYAAAITHPDVLGAIRSGFNGRIAIAYMEWGSPASQHTIVDWTVIEDAASASRFAVALVAAPRQAIGYNSISKDAIVYSANMTHDNRYDGFRKIIDVSADAEQRGGQPLALVRQATVMSGITINGLAIDRPGSSRPLGAGRLEEHFRRDVIGGAGAFVMIADEENSFAEAVLRKLLLEIAGAGPTDAIQAAHAPAGAVTLAGDVSVAR